MTTESMSYPARLEIDYPEELERISTLFRLILAIPIVVIIAMLTAGATQTVIDDTGDLVSNTTGGISAGLFFATLAMIVVRQKYPRWWFDFLLELTRFGMRIGAYVTLLTDQYPSTTDEQSVHLDLDYPDAEQDLNQWMPLVKWILAIPHYVALIGLGIAAILAVIAAWFAILFTGAYPRPLFDFVVGVARWGLRVEAYMAFLITDEYPPFSLS